jgi:hypothetical protein
MFGFSSFSETPFASLVNVVIVPLGRDFYVEGVKVKAKEIKVLKKDTIEYDEELAILMLMAA